MENNQVRKEVLLVTTSIHSQKELYEKDTPEGSALHGQINDKLEEACWDGLLVNWLPEIVARQENGIYLYLWKVRLAHMFLFAEFAEAPFTTDPEFTLDPYLFLAGSSKN